MPACHVECRGASWGDKGFFKIIRGTDFLNFESSAYAGYVWPSNTNIYRSDGQSLDGVDFPTSTHTPMATPDNELAGGMWQTVDDMDAHIVHHTTQPMVRMALLEAGVPVLDEGVLDDEWKQHVYGHVTSLRTRVVSGPWLEVTFENGDVIVVRCDATLECVADVTVSSA